MVVKRVTFEYEFEYDSENFDDFSDSNIEYVAFETLTNNIHDLGHGTVELVED